ncbi:MAG TPA: HAD-IA family hydrolase, partial [Gaiellaceae bacterium]|nr:HAD-IA family hydrolase [Gaiellaceae bacterium]
ERHFDVVVTTDMTELHKPHPEPVLKALELLGADPAGTAFVGDSPFDVAAGKAAGVFTVAVTWGNIHPVERLEEAGADLIVRTPEELLDGL